jgi:hypothetical protein
MHGSRSKIPSKNLVRQRCTEGFNSGVKGLSDACLYIVIYFIKVVHPCRLLFNCYIKNTVLHNTYTSFPEYPFRLCQQPIIRTLSTAAQWNVPQHTRLDLITLQYSGPGSSVGIATGYGLDGPGIESRWGETFRTCPERPCGPLSFLYNGYRIFPGVESDQGVKLTPHPLVVPWSTE